jgi:hypothetical protein
MAETTIQTANAQVCTEYVETASHLIRGVRLYDETPSLLGDENRQAIATAPEVEPSAAIRAPFDGISVPLRFFAVHPGTDETKRPAPDYLLLVLLVPLHEYDSVDEAKQTLDRATSEIEHIRRDTLIDGDRLPQLQAVVLDRVAQGTDARDAIEAETHAHSGDRFERLRRWLTSGGEHA